MNRRMFLKSTMGLAASAMLPSMATAGAGLQLPLDKVSFGSSNDAQTIIIYLMGGMGEIIGNMSNFDELVSLDPAYNNYLNDFTRTNDDFWQEAGGDHILAMVDNGDATIFRTCYQTDTVRAHLLNQIRNMRGNNVGYDSGMVTTLMHVLDEKDSSIHSKMMPNVSFVDSNFQLLTDAATAHALPSSLKPVSFSPYEPSNPFVRKSAAIAAYSDEALLDSLSQQMNAAPGLNPLIGDMFAKRKDLETFFDDLLNTSLPDGIDYQSDIKGSHRYDDYGFGKSLEFAMRIMISNPDTKVISMTTESWDDHSNALTLHQNRAKYLFKAIKTAIDHAKAENRENINIILFGDFGRNMMINNALGWDHGNNQNFMWFGGSKYVNHMGVVGTTKLSSGYGRVYSFPTDDSYAFEPYAIAATFYKINGIKNPEIFTGGIKAIGDDGLGMPFIKNV